MNNEDKKLIELAKNTLKLNYDGCYHTVASSVLCTNGKMYSGINMDVIHGSCAEFIAMGAALTNGERSFKTIVSVAQTATEVTIVNSCGNCRQMLRYLAPDIKVICHKNKDLLKVSIKELLPYEYTSRSKKQYAAKINAS